MTPWPAGIGMLAAAVLAGACHGRGDAEAGRAAAAAMQRSIPDVDATALAQTIDAGTITEVQRQLTVLHEYQGAIDGQLDAVLVNALQAFQRSAGLRDDGRLTAETRRRLTRAAAATPAAP